MFYIITLVTQNSFVAMPPFLHHFKHSELHSAYPPKFEIAIHIAEFSSPHPFNDM